MLPAFENVFSVFPLLRICPERPHYDVWSRFEDGFIILRKDGQLFRNRFMRVAKWQKHHLEFLRSVNYMAGRTAWIELMKVVVTPHLINGYEVEDVIFLDATIPERIAELRKIPALKFREFKEK